MVIHSILVLSLRSLAVEFRKATRPVLDVPTLSTIIWNTNINYF
jgi:hypothetical protein